MDSEFALLNPKEQLLLRLLRSAKGSVVDRSALLKELGPVRPRTLDTYIKQIRRKLAQAGSHAKIRTHAGLGFSYESDVDYMR